MFRKILSIALSLGLLLQQAGFAYAIGELNLSNYLNNPLNSAIAANDKFRPIHLRYFSYDSLNNSYKILLDKGDSKGLKESQLKDEAKELMNYFLIGLALPNDTFWVNLRPDAADNIIDPLLEKTDIGKIFLEADLQLKKDTSSLTSPKTPEGKHYWDKLYKRAGELFGTENITIPTITRPWIVPNEIIVRETDDSAYIYKATLKVMLEADYLRSPSHQVTRLPNNQPLTSNYSFSDPRLKELNEYSSQLIRETIIPRLTKEINSSKRYAKLRQAYYSIILSRWFKMRFYGKNSAYSRLIDSRDLTNLSSGSSWDKNTYFHQYQDSFNKGEYNLKEQVATSSGQSLRSYVSGGVGLKIGIDGGNPNIGMMKMNTPRASSGITDPLLAAAVRKGVVLDNSFEAVEIKSSSGVSAAGDSQGIEGQLYGYLDNIEELKLTGRKDIREIEGLIEKGFPVLAAYRMAKIYLDYANKDGKSPVLGQKDQMRETGSSLLNQARELRQADIEETKGRIAEILDKAADNALGFINNQRIALGRINDVSGLSGLLREVIPFLEKDQELIVARGESLVEMKEANQELALRLKALLVDMVMMDKVRDMHEGYVDGYKELRELYNNDRQGFKDFGEFLDNRSLSEDWILAMVGINPSLFEYENLLPPYKASSALVWNIEKINKELLGDPGKKIEFKKSISPDEIYAMGKGLLQQILSLSTNENIKKEYLYMIERIFNRSGQLSPHLRPLFNTLVGVLNDMKIPVSTDNEIKEQILKDLIEQGMLSYVRKCVEGLERIINANTPNDKDERRMAKAGELLPRGITSYTYKNWQTGRIESKTDIDIDIIIEVCELLLESKVIKSKEKFSSEYYQKLLEDLKIIKGWVAPVSDIARTSSPLGSSPLVDIVMEGHKKIFGNMDVLVEFRRSVSPKEIYDISKDILQGILSSSTNENVSPGYLNAVYAIFDQAYQKSPYLKSLFNVLKNYINNTIGFGSQGDAKKVLKEVTEKELKELIYSGMIRYFQDGIDYLGKIVDGARLDGAKKAELREGLSECVKVYAYGGKNKTDIDIDTIIVICNILQDSKVVPEDKGATFRALLEDMKIIRTLVSSPIITLDGLGDDEAGKKKALDIKEKAKAAILARIKEDPQQAEERPGKRDFIITLYSKISGQGTKFEIKDIAEYYAKEIAGLEDSAQAIKQWLEGQIAVFAEISGAGPFYSSHEAVRYADEMSAVYNNLIEELNKPLASSGVVNYESDIPAVSIIKAYTDALWAGIINEDEHKIIIESFEYNPMLAAYKLGRIIKNKLSSNQINEDVAAGYLLRQNGYEFLLDGKGITEWLYWLEGQDISRLRTLVKGVLDSILSMIPERSNLRISINEQIKKVVTIPDNYISIFEFLNETIDILNEELPTTEINRGSSNDNLKAAESELRKILSIVFTEAILLKIYDIPWFDKQIPVESDLYVNDFKSAISRIPKGSSYMSDYEYSLLEKSLKNLPKQKENYIRFNSGVVPVGEILLLEIKKSMGELASKLQAVQDIGPDLTSSRIRFIHNWYSRRLLGALTDMQDSIKESMNSYDISLSAGKNFDQKTYDLLESSENLDNALFEVKGYLNNSFMIFLRKYGGSVRLEVTDNYELKFGNSNMAARDALREYLPPRYGDLYDALYSVSLALKKYQARRMFLNTAWEKYGTDTTKANSPTREGGLAVAKDGFGGIDFTAGAMRIKLERMGSLKDLRLILPKLSNAQDINLDGEFSRIQATIQAGIIPSGRRILEFISACYSREELDERLIDIIACLADACKLEELNAVESREDLRLALLMPEALYAYGRGHVLN